jgi:serine phosphatase RsbU (regulator of sigma subunit)
MTGRKMHLSGRVLSFVLNIGADPADTPYIRLIKRIWYASSAVSLPVSLYFTITEYLGGRRVDAAAFLFSFFLFGAFLWDGARSPRHFERNVFFLLVYFIIAPAAMTVASGGIWRSQGAIMVGLLGPLFALILPRRRRALILFGLYAALVLVLAGLWPFPEEKAVAPAGLDTFQFWVGFLILLGFVFGAMYFFVVQREKAYQLLAVEKEKSERLLRRIENDLAQAAEIQKRLLPTANPRFGSFDIAGMNISCYEVGGDYFDFVPIDDDRLGVVIADVSGKGISAALLMASLRSALLAEVQPGFDIAVMAGRLNDFVHRSTDSKSFITFFFGILDRETAEFRYVNAGHNPPFVARKTGEYETLGSSGFPLGMFPAVSYDPGTLNLRDGDVTVLFTDGIPEARGESGLEFTEERLRASVAALRDLPAADLCRTVLEEARAFASATEPCDDTTLVILKRSSDAAEGLMPY